MAVRTITVESASERLDRFLAARVADLSRSAVQQLIRNGEVLVNGAEQKPSYVPRLGDVITVRLPAQEPMALTAEPIPLRIVFEDHALLVIDKQPGLVVHPSPGHRPIAPTSFRQTRILCDRASCTGWTVTRRG